MEKFEQDYQALIEDILENGEERQGRNGVTKSLFGKTLFIDMTDSLRFPLLLGRKMYYKGIFGEFAAFMHQPKSNHDFEKYGCNYWKLWCNEHGNLKVDYGNKWLNFNGVNQIEQVRNALFNNPYDRRMIITGWDPASLETNSLPCCHLLYQWYVRKNKYLDMIWYQRSADSLIGIPSDIVLAALWNLLLANNVGLLPGKITMVFGDTHIYEEHYDGAKLYLEQDVLTKVYPAYRIDCELGMNIELFTPNMIKLHGYNPNGPINFKLKE